MATGNWTAFVREHKEFTYDKTKDEMITTFTEGEKLVSASPYVAFFDFPLEWLYFTGHVDTRKIRALRRWVP